MKTLMMTALLILSQNVAFAEVNAESLRLFCSSPGPTGTPGYVASVVLKLPAGSNGGAARVRLPGLSSEIAMKCVMPLAQPRTSYPDQILTLGFCDDGSRDGGYSLQLRSGGNAGVTTASLIAKNYAQNQEIAQMDCRSAGKNAPRY